jgi:hypothetical protein
MPRFLKYLTEEDRIEAKREQARRAKQRYAERRRMMVDMPFRPHPYNFLRPDPQTLAERDERLAIIYASELTPNQVILGDPLPGRSALEANRKT